MGKILITKTYGLSNLMYAMSSQSCNNIYTQKAQSIINSFIWSGKPAKVKHKTLIGPYVEGRFRSPDIATQIKSLRLAWLARLINEDTCNPIQNFYFKKYGGLKLLLRCDYNAATLHIPKFYREMLSFLREIFEPIESTNIIWNNHAIAIDKNSIYYEKWYDKGIVNIRDITHENGTFLSFKEFQTKYHIKTNYLKYIGIVQAIKAASFQTQMLKSITTSRN